MGGFAGKQRRQRSANAIATKLVKAGIVSPAEKQGVMRRIAKSGTLGAMGDFLKFGKPKGSRRATYTVVAPKAPKAPTTKKTPKRSQKGSFKLGSKS